MCVYARNEERSLKLLRVYGREVVVESEAEFHCEQGYRLISKEVNLVRKYTI